MCLFITDDFGNDIDNSNRITYRIETKFGSGQILNAYVIVTDRFLNLI